MRVARQEEIVAALDRDINYRSQAALAREILVSLNSSLNLMKHHLVDWGTMEMLTPCMIGQRFGTPAAD
jgi:hypothetical protein